MDVVPQFSRSRELVPVLAALADENRFRIVEVLAYSSSLSCASLCATLGLSPSLISHHLSILEGVALVERRKNGLWTLNRLRHDELGRHVSDLQRLANAQALPGPG